MYDEVQEEIATWERSLEEELKKFEEQVGLVGFIFQPLLRLTPSLDSVSPIGTAISGTRYLFVVHKCPHSDVDRPCTGHLPCPDKGQSDGRPEGLDQERRYKGGDSVVSTTPIDMD